MADLLSFQNSLFSLFWLAFLVLSCSVRSPRSRPDTLSLAVYLSFHHKSSEQVEVPSTPEVTDRANPQPTRQPSLATGDKESEKK